MASLLTRKSKIEQHRLCVTKMEISIGLWWESGQILPASRLEVLLQNLGLVTLRLRGVIHVVSWGGELPLPLLLLLLFHLLRSLLGFDGGCSLLHRFGVISGSLRPQQREQLGIELRFQQLAISEPDWPRLACDEELPYVAFVAHRKKLIFPGRDNRGDGGGDLLGRAGDTNTSGVVKFRLVQVCTSNGLQIQNSSVQLDLRVNFLGSNALRQEGFMAHCHSRQFGGNVVVQHSSGLVAATEGTSRFKDPH
mmetsp:Transcript_17261/g.40632  ORF Transcript_17261/g.40632 Transcript_17261/m.40632 type:complete len:251 (-) Transcript_17261:122-874(-)